MRVWGRVQGARQTDSDPLGTPGFVWGFLEVPSGSHVDVQVGRFAFPAVLMAWGAASATFQVRDRRKGVGRRLITLSAAVFRLHVARDTFGQVFPDYDGREFRKLLTESARLEREGC